jgi:uncharacterized membrane protein
MNLDLTNIIGILGASLVLLAFTMLEQNYWGRNKFKYNFTNAIGSLLLIIYGLATQAWPFVVLNTVWFLISSKETWLSLHRRG